MISGDTERGKSCAEASDLMSEFVVGHVAGLLLSKVRVITDGCLVARFFIGAAEHILEVSEALYLVERIILIFCHDKTSYICDFL